jgi:hypothetical protein
MGCCAPSGASVLATCGTIPLKLLKLAGLVRVSARRVKFELA